MSRAHTRRKLKAAPNLGPGLVDKGFDALAPCAGRAMSARQIAVLKLCLKNKNGRAIMRGVGVGLPTSEALIRAGRAVWGKPHETPRHGNLKTIEITDKGRLDLFMALGPIPELNGWTPPPVKPRALRELDELVAGSRPGATPEQQARAREIARPFEADPVARAYTNLDRHEGRPARFQTADPNVRFEFRIAGAREGVGVKVTENHLEITANDQQLVLEPVAGNTIRIKVREF